MRRNLFYRLSLIVLAALIATVPLLADSLVLIEGDYDSFSLYDPSGKRVDNLSDISAPGYIIRSRAHSDAVFGSPFGTVTTGGQTLFSVTGLSYENPSIYLLDGMLTIDYTATSPLTVFTTTARYDIQGPGTYQIIYTEDEDLFIDLGGSGAKVSDPLRNQQYQIASGEYSNLLARSLEERRGEITSLTESLVEGNFTVLGNTFTYSLERENGTFTYPEYITIEDAEGFLEFLHTEHPEFAITNYSLTPGKAVAGYGTRLTIAEREAMAELFDDFIMEYLTKLLTPPTPAFDDVAVEFDPLVSGESLVGSYRITYKLYEEYGIVTLPEGLSRAEAEAFFAYIAKEHPEESRGIVYRFTDENEVILHYNARLNSKELNYGVALIASYIDEYLNPAPVVPAMPIFISSTTARTSLLEGTIERLGYTLTYSLDDEGGIVTLPAIVTEADVDAFMAYLIKEEGEFLSGATYKHSDDGSVVIDYGTVIPKGVRASLVPLFEEYLDSYIASLSIPADPVVDESLSLPRDSAKLSAPEAPILTDVRSVVIPEAPEITKVEYVKDEDDSLDAPSFLPMSYSM